MESFRTALMHDPVFKKHITGSGHPEWSGEIRCESSSALKRKDGLLLG